MINKYDMLNNAIEAICNSAPDTFESYRMEITIMTMKRLRLRCLD